MEFDFLDYSIVNFKLSSMIFTLYATKEKLSKKDLFPKIKARNKGSSLKISLEVLVFAKSLLTLGQGTDRVGQGTDRACFFTLVFSINIPILIYYTFAELSLCLELLKNYLSYQTH